MKGIICWWSGGITSSVACKKAIEIYGKEQCRVIFIDTFNEHPDTYRFKDDCSEWYGLEVETITVIGKKYKNIKDVWFKRLSLNTANGAICSSELKKKARTNWQKENKYQHQVFGFEFETREFKRSLALSLNHPDARAIYPLLMLGMNKQDCIEFTNAEGIKPPSAYELGFMNNNCLGTGCVQGGIGYWQHMKKTLPENYDEMARIEHELTDLKGSPVSMLKDQTKESIKMAKELNMGRRYMPLFLKSHPKYPEIKTVMDKEVKPIEPLKDCNGFCGIDDLVTKSKTEEEINHV